MDGDAGAVPRGGPHRLLWLIDSLTMGGAEALVLPFARAARKRAVELTICARTTIGGNPLEQELRSASVNVVNLDARNLRDVGAMRRLSRLVRDLRPEIIHAHLTYAAIWGSLIAWRHRVPFVASLHVPPSRDGGLRESIRQRLMVFLLNRLSARVVVVSRALVHQWEKITSLDSSKIAIVHNGIDLEPVSPETDGSIRQELGIGSEAPLIATVAVLRRDKGIDTLLRAAREVLDRRGDCVLVVVGDGPMKDEWKSLADDLGITRSVRWTGFRRDVASILAEADLFVLPTLRDAFPTVLLEAFAAGAPVIASEVGGVPEIVEDERTGMLVPPGDMRALADAINRALGDASWRDRAAEAARTKVERDFSVDAWFTRLENLYSVVLRESSGRHEGKR